MAITLDATLAGETSNSYIDMTAALAIASNMPGGGDWAALGEEERNLSLIVATRWLETLTYGGQSLFDDAAAEVATLTSPATE